jgi:hypothetical protein
VLRHFDGFDSYPTADLGLRYNIPGNGSFRVVPGAGRFGSGGLQNVASGGSEALAKFFDDQPTWVAGVCYKFDLAGKATMIITFQDSGQGQVELWMNTSNILCIRRNGTLLASGTTPLTVNTFYFLELKATIGSSGSAAVHIGGTPEVTFSGNTDAQGSGKANRVCLFYDQFQIQNTFDDYYICDGTGSRNNDFLGDVRVEDLSPSGLGFYSNFAVTGAATAVLAVNETTEDGDTSYVSSATVGDRETFTFPNLTSAPSAVYGVQFVAVARKDDAGSRALTPLVRHAGTNYLGVQQALPDSYAYVTQTLETNPATGSPFTGTEVNGLEAGFQTTQ